MNSRNPMAKRAVKTTPMVHQGLTRNNTPGGVPLIQRARNHTVIDNDDATPAVATQTRSTIPMAQSCLVAQQALTALTIWEAIILLPAYTPCIFRNATPPLPHIDIEHYSNPMVHPVMGKNISSYKKLMNNPANAEVLQTAFGKDFEGMAQGDNKTRQKATNAMFMMTHDEIAHAYHEKIYFAFANPVVNYRPQKGDPNQIRIIAMGNLITYNGELSVRTAEINTVKLHWNSVMSTPNAKYMCLDIKKNYLTAALEYFEYMKMPLTSFPSWIIKQYNLKTHAKDGST